MRPGTEETGEKEEGRVRRALSVIRTIVGMPDYDRYLEHCRMRHPGEHVLSPSEFYAEFVTRRYGNGPSRCC